MLNAFIVLPQAPTARPWVCSRSSAARSATSMLAVTKFRSAAPWTTSSIASMWSAPPTPRMWFSMFPRMDLALSNPASSRWYTTLCFFGCSLRCEARAVGGTSATRSTAARVKSTRIAGLLIVSAPVHRRETEAAVLPDDEAGCRERGQDEDAGVGVDLDERAPRGARFRGVVAEAARPLRLGDLHRAVHEVTGEDRLPRGRPEADRDVARRVAGRRLEAEPVVDRIVGVHEGRLARLDDRHHAVGDARVLFVAREPPLLASEDVARVRRLGQPAVAHAPRVQSDVVDVQPRAQDDVHLRQRQARQA